jgi:hypothetical protein
MDFDDKWLPAVEGSALPGTREKSFDIRPGPWGAARIQREFVRAGSDWAPGALVFEVGVTGKPAPDARLNVTLNSSVTGTRQLGATVPLKSIATAGTTKMFFNTPADALAVLKSNKASVTLAIAIENGAGTTVHVAALRATTSRTAPDGQGSLGRWDELWTTAAPTELSSKATVGNQSQRVCGGGHRRLESPPFNPLDLSWISRHLAIDVHAPSGPSNPGWHGNLHFYYFNREQVSPQDIGQVELSGPLAGEWVTLSVQVPEPIFQRLKLDRAGSQLQIVVDADEIAGACLQLDNLRFMGPLELNARPVVETPR